MAANRIILDSGALSQFAEKGETIRVALRKALDASAIVVLPTVVIAETTTGSGPRDANVNRAAKACRIEGLDEQLARASAALRFARPDCGVVDATVVATADAVPGSTILTGDSKDLRTLAGLREVTTVLAV